MKTVNRRLARLEERFAPTTQDRVKKHLRVVVCRVGGGVPDLQKSTAKRTLCPNGTLLEYVKLNGASELISNEKLEEWVLSFPVKTLEESRTDRRDHPVELGDSIFRDPRRSTPPKDLHPFIEPTRPMLPATVEPATPKEATAKPPTWPEVPRDPIEEEMRRRENRRLDLPPIDPAETPHQAEMRRQEEMRRDRKRFGPTLPPIDLR